MVQQHTGQSSPADQIKELKRRIRNLETGRRIGNTVLSQGTLTIEDVNGTAVAAIGDLSDASGALPTNRGLVVYGGGSLWVYDPTNTLFVMYAGALNPGFNRPDGRTQQGFVLYRDDGSLALALADLSPLSGGYHQSLQTFDRSDHVIFADDTTSGTGHARPWLFQGPWTSQVNFPVDTTTSGTFVTLQQSIGVWQQPRWQGQFLFRASDGTTAGEMRVIDQNSNQLGTTVTILAGAYLYVQVGPVSLPGSYGDSLTIQVQARRTAGTGTIGVQGIYSLQLQS